MQSLKTSRFGSLIEWDQKAKSTVSSFTSKHVFPALLRTKCQEEQLNRPITIGQNKTSSILRKMDKAHDPSLERCFRGHKDSVSSVAFNSNMKQVISGGLDGTLMLWHFNTKLRAFRFLGHRDAVYSVAYDSVNNLIASASKDKTVRLWHPTADGRSTVIKAHTGAVRCCDFSQNGKMLLTGSDDKSLKVWSVPTQKFLFCLSGHTNWVRTCHFSPDARLAVSGSDDRTVRVWDLETRSAVNTFEEIEGSVNVTKFHPDGTCVATGGTDGSIKLWDLRSNRLIQYYEAHKGTVTDISFHTSGNFLLSSSMDTSLKIWDLQEGLLFYTLHGHTAATTGVSFSPDGTQFVSCGADQQVMVWRTNFDKCLADFGVTVTVAGEMTTTTEEAVRQKLTQLRSGQRPEVKAQKSHQRGPASKTSASNGSMATDDTLTSTGQHSLPGSNLIKAANTQQQSTGALQDGSHASFESLSLNAADMSEDLASTLQHMVGQLDMLTQTMAVMEERLTINEDRTRRLEGALHKQIQSTESCVLAPRQHGMHGPLNATSTQQQQRPLPSKSQEAAAPLIAEPSLSC